MDLDLLLSDPAKRPAPVWPVASPEVSFRTQLWRGFCLALGVLGALWHFIPLPDASNRLAALSASRPGLAVSASNLPLTEVEQAAFGDSKVVKRECVVGQQRFMVEVVDASAERHANLDPLFALRSAGWVIGGDREVGIPGGSARWVSLIRRDATSEAMVWISDTKVRHSSEARHWWQSVLRRMTFGASGPEPVLVIVQPTTEGRVAWNEMFSRLPALLDI